MKSVTTNGFYEGVSRDLSKHIDQLTTMWNNENFRITTQDGESYAALENVKGNSAFVDIVGTQLQIDIGWEIIGHCIVRDDIVLFGVNRNTNSSRIYLYKFNTLVQLYVPRIILYDDTSLPNKLNFNNRITTLPRYENEYIIKVYWTDNDNNMRYMNIAPDIDLVTNLPKQGYLSSDYTRIQGQDIEDFELLQKITLSQPTFVGYTSGNLMSGMVQYAYRLYNKYGGESMFSPTTPLIPIFEHKLDFGTIKGYDTNKQSNKGINGTITLSGNSLLFDKIEIVSLHYAYYNAIPTINVLDIQPVTSTINFIDTGIYTFGQISLSEFTEVKNDFTCKTFETKDDRLFIGNVKETYFNVDDNVFDARVYRFNGTKRAKCYEQNSFNSSINKYYYIRPDGTWNQINGDGSSGNDWNIPEDANLINPYNILSQDSVLANPFQRYQSDGLTLGGTGKNISYYISYTANALDDDLTAVGTNININDKPNYHLGIEKGFIRDEIYRFGIVFFDNKGRQSFAKWIGDIRMPSYDYNNLITEVSNTLYGNQIYVHFTVNNLPRNADNSIMKYQIVYVKREDKDKTNLGSVLVIPTYRAGNLYTTIQSVNNGGFFTDVVEVFSPDIDMSDINYDDCELRIAYKLTDLYNKNIKDFFKRQKVRGIVTNNIINYNITKVKEIQGLQQNMIDPGVALDEIIISIDNNKLLSLGQKNIVTGLETYSLASTYLLMLDNDIELYPYIGAIRRDTIGYNGNTYTARTTNSYIPVCDINNGTTKYGDTNIYLHEKLRSTVYQNDSSLDVIDDPQGKTTFVVFPIETSIVTLLVRNTKFNEIYSDLYNYLIQENDNSIFVNTDTTLTITRDWTDLYLYNRVYSQLNTTKQYPAKPLDWQKQVSFDTRIRYSNLKFNGEERDSWLQFMPNNFNEIDSSYGQLNELVNFRNELFCFQESGFCVAPVNQQVLEESDTGVTTVLGYGTVLPKQFNYNYGSTEVGIQGNNHIIKSLSALYWIDINKRKLYRYSGTVDSFSDVKGLKGYLNNIICNDTEYIGIYDNEFSEILLSFENTTLVFSEISDVFQGWYTFTPTIYIKTPRDLLSTNDNNRMYKHNIGNRAYWYDTLYDSKLSIIVNSTGSITKEFNNIEYMTEVFDEDGIDVPNETFTTLQASNDVMTSDVITLKPYQPGDTLYQGGLEVTLPPKVANIRRRMRMWRTVVPRVLRTNQYINNARFRDAYVKLSFVYNNINNYKMVVHPINTYFNSSNM